MFIDASALTAILLEEKDFAIFAAALDQAEIKRVTPFVLMESGLAVMRETNSEAERVYADIDQTLRYFRIESAELTTGMILAALQAYERYGKGRGHPARLNMGDCLSYAAARILGLPLLYKGEDLARTDIASALA